MVAAFTKSVLFSTVRHNKTVAHYPVAVFPNEKDARAYAAFLRLSFRAGDVESYTKLDPAITLTDDGKLPADVRWSLKTVPYSPSPDFGDDDDMTTTPPAT